MLKKEMTPTKNSTSEAFNFRNTAINRLNNQVVLYRIKRAIFASVQGR